MPLNGFDVSESGHYRLDADFKHVVFINSASNGLGRGFEKAGTLTIGLRVA